MPDETRKTISSTQCAALVGESKWETEFTLSEWFRGRELPDDSDERMSWGLKMQPLLLEQAAADLRLEVIPNEGDIYTTRDIFGATLDSTIICPDRGPGSLETKVVFDYIQWMERWSGGDRPPVDYEIQLQIQMYVGDGTTHYEWGVIAAWLAGEMHYFERKPDEELWANLHDLGEKFLARVSDENEKFDPFGLAIEFPWITNKWPVVERKTLDLTEGSDDNVALAETARMYAWCQAQKSEFTKLERELKTKLVGLAEDNDTVALPADIYINVSKSKPSSPKLVTEDMVGEPIRKSSITTRLKITAPEKPHVKATEEDMLDA
jgi:hypothetical protein